MLVNQEDRRQALGALNRMSWERSISPNGDPELKIRVSASHAASVVEPLTKLGVLPVIASAGIEFDRAASRPDNRVEVVIPARFMASLSKDRFTSARDFLKEHNEEKLDPKIREGSRTVRWAAGILQNTPWKSLSDANGVCLYHKLLADEEASDLSYALRVVIGNEYDLEHLNMASVFMITPKGVSMLADLGFDFAQQALKNKGQGSRSR